MSVVNVDAAVKNTSPAQTPERTRPHRTEPDRTPKEFTCENSVLNRAIAVTKERDNDFFAAHPLRSSPTPLEKGINSSPHSRLTRDFLNEHLATTSQSLWHIFYLLFEASWPYRPGSYGRHTIRSVASSDTPLVYRTDQTKPESIEMIWNSESK